MEDPNGWNARVSRETGIDIHALNRARHSNTQLNTEQLQEIDKVRPRFRSISRALDGHEAIKPEDVAQKLDKMLQELTSIKDEVAATREREKFFMSAIETEREYLETLKKLLEQ